jgi:hypothetical protein
MNQTKKTAKITRKSRSGTPTTRNAQRKSPMLTVTLPLDVHAMLDEMGPRYGSKSATVATALRILWQSSERPEVRPSLHGQR